ncbi:MAG: Re/Si-specific NAD(P)(+) transhydrogenase subunit alpha [Proteobacteria bacterium]|nr:Re/Si-specific NAD(P)(+) transhydrogenase subunit alpha [Pseudomonadota bacterium]
MKIAILRERRANETRVAVSPETAKKFVGLGCEVVIEKNAGAGAAYTDAAFKAAGAAIAKDSAAACKGARMILKVQRPAPAELGAMPAGAVLVAMLDPHRAGDELQAIAEAGLTSFAMELMPRITRAQSMDVLSSQANLAGYKAVLDAAGEYGRAYPMLMTAAGRINPAQVLVMGAGVAGLQAIATARRLGAVVHATDVRPAAKEQVESLGGKFVAVEDEEFKQAETAAGYAKEMSGDYKKKQAALIAETLPKMDVVITTAAIPGRPAPKLISAAMVKSMKPGSVIVDLAVETGGNCELTEAGKVVVKHGVKIVGHLNVPGRLAADASMLYANNLFNFVSLLYDKESKELAIDWEDEIVQGTLVTRDGAVVHPELKPSGTAPAPTANVAPEGAPEDTPEDTAETSAEDAAEEAESDG